MVNWVSEQLQTAAVSTPVILLSVHVHMCIYDGRTGLRHREQLIMHMLLGINEIPDSTGHVDNDQRVTSEGTKINLYDMKKLRSFPRSLFNKNKTIILLWNLQSTGTVSVIIPAIHRHEVCTFVLFMHRLALQLVINTPRQT